MTLARGPVAVTVILMVLCAAIAVPLARDQQPPATINPTAGTGQITGTVIAADTGLPVRRATVRLSGFPPSSP